MNAYNAHAFTEADYSTAWGEPDLTLLGSNRRPAPAFPIQLLGPFWSAWATRAAEGACAPVDYCATSLLAAVGASIANVRRPLAGRDWSEPPLIWVGLVGSPSTGKSPSMDKVLDLVSHAEDQLAAGFDEVRRDYETRKQGAKANREVWEGQVREAAKAGAQTPAMPANAEEPEPPVRPRIRIGDATTEKQAALAAALPKGQLIVRDELAGWLGQFDRYGGGGSDRAFALESFGGRSYRVDRMKNQEPINIRHLSIGILGSIQPDRISVITGGADDGLASRILWSWPEGSPKFRFADGIPDDMPARYAFARLTDLDMAQDNFGNLEPRLIRLDRDAQDALQLFSQEIAAKADEAGGVFAGALGKARGQALRLSAVLTFLWWCATPGKPEPLTIPKEAMVAACGLMQGYFVRMAERVFGDAAIPVAEQHAMLLAKRLRQLKAATFNAREIGRQGSAVLRDPEAMEAACKLLMEAGLIRRQQVGEHSGRKPKNFDVHPAVFGRM